MALRARRALGRHGWMRPSSARDLIVFGAVYESLGKRKAEGSKAHTIRGYDLEKGAGIV